MHKGSMHKGSMHKEHDASMHKGSMHEEHDASWARFERVVLISCMRAAFTMEHVFMIRLGLAQTVHGISIYCIYAVYDRIYAVFPYIYHMWGEMDSLRIKS
jgi:hypothetical protein